MKKHNLMLKNFLAVFAASCVLCLTGCTSLSYTGEDCDQKNISTVQTEELFTFSTYKKPIEADEIIMKVGVSKTPLPDAYVAYINIENLSDVADYIFYLKDLTIKAGNETLTPIAPSAYLEAYQRYETGTYAGLSSLAPTLGNFASIQNSYQGSNVTAANIQNAADKSSVAATSEIGSIANGIAAHTITASAIVGAKENRFFYIFLKDPKFLPIDILYKDLKFTFGQIKK